MLVMRNSVFYIRIHLVIFVTAQNVTDMTTLRPSKSKQSVGLKGPTRTSVIEPSKARFRKTCALSKQLNTDFTDLQ